MSAGLDGDAFWRRTPRLVAAELEGRARASEREESGRAWLAWNIGMLSGVDMKHYPKSPADLLPKKATSAKPDWRSMEQAALAWTVNRGGSVLRA